MRNKKLFKLLRLLSKEELGRFGDFVRSPFFNKNQKAIMLWNLLEDYAPGFEQEELKDYRIYHHIYDKPVSIETVFRYTTRLFEDFLVQIRQREEHYYKKYLLLDELMRLGSLRDFMGQYKAIRGRLNMEKRRGPAYYYVKFLIGKAHLDYLVVEGAGAEERAKFQKHISEDLERFYIALSVDLAAESAMLENRPCFDNKLKGLQADLAEKTDRTPVLSMQYYLLCCGLEGKREDFKRIIDLPNEIIQALPSKDLHKTYRYAAHFCLKKTETDPAFLDLFFGLCQKALSYAFPKQVQEEAIFWIKKMVETGCALNYYSETEIILQRIKNYFPAETKELDYQFYLGYISYREKNIPKAIKHFKAARTYKQAVGILANSFLLRIYFETNESDLRHHIKEFSLRTQKSKSIAKSVKNTHLQFAKLLELLFKGKKTENGTADLKDMVALCAEEHREWLESLVE